MELFPQRSVPRGIPLRVVLHFYSFALNLNETNVVLDGWEGFVTNPADRMDHQPHKQVAHSPGVLFTHSDAILSFRAKTFRGFGYFASLERLPLWLPCVVKRFFPPGLGEPHSCSVCTRPQVCSPEGVGLPNWPCMLGPHVLTLKVGCWLRSAGARLLGHEFTFSLTQSGWITAAAAWASGVPSFSHIPIQTQRPEKGGMTSCPGR